MTLAVLIAAWKLSFYGELLPTAFYSKSAASPYYLQGLRYVGLYLAKSWYLVPALLVVPWLAARRDAARGAPARAGRVGARRPPRLPGNGRLPGRLRPPQRRRLHVRAPLVPIAPFLLLALESWLVSIERRGRCNGPRRWSLVAGAALPYPVFGEGRWRIEGIADEPHFYPPEAIATRREQGERLGAMLGATPVRVMFEGGMCMFAYYSKLPYLVEMTGLTQYSLARLPLAERGLIGHEKQPDDRWLDDNEIHLVVAQEWPIAPPPPGARQHDEVYSATGLGQGPHLALLRRGHGPAARAPGGLVHSDRAGDRAPARARWKRRRSRARRPSTTTSTATTCGRRARAAPRSKSSCRRCSTPSDRLEAGE